MSEYKRKLIKPEETKDILEYEIFATKEKQKDSNRKKREFDKKDKEKEHIDDDVALRRSKKIKTGKRNLEEDNGYFSYN